MAYIELVIKIDEDAYKEIKKIVADGNEMCFMQKLIANGTSLDKHDEEVIAETVENIWGKPPYMDMLDKIRAEVEALNQDYYCQGDFDKCKDYVLDIIDEYRKGD